MPRYDDEGSLGIRFFRARLVEEKLDRLTLPRTFFGRSEICAVSFRETNLSESSANWNGFFDVDFTMSNLSDCDFRACVFERVCFAHALLHVVDFRWCTFTDCNFAGAEMSGVKLTKETVASLGLSTEQRSAIDIHESDGDEPTGG